jgi:hypothetical protein
LLVDQQLDIACPRRWDALRLRATLWRLIALRTPQEFFDLIAQRVGLLAGRSGRRHRLWAGPLCAPWRLGCLIGFDDFLDDPKRERTERDNRADDPFDISKQR